MSADSKFYEVAYDKKIGTLGKLVVKASSESNAINNAKNCCFTGSNFRNPIECEKRPTFSDLHSNGRCGRNRKN